MIWVVAIEPWNPYIVDSVWTTPEAAAARSLARDQHCGLWRGTLDGHTAGHRHSESCVECVCYSDHTRVIELQLDVGVDLSTLPRPLPVLE